MIDTKTGKVCFVAKDGVIPEPPEGKKWTLIKIGLLVAPNITQKMFQNMDNKTALNAMFMLATDKESAQEAISKQIGQIFDAVEKFNREGNQGLENLVKNHQ